MTADDNYCALCISIIKGVSPEEAFYLFYKQKVTGTDAKAMVGNMIALKGQGKTYKQIGAMYNMTAHAVYHRIRRVTGRMR